jgi:hypothetical protein
MTKKGKEQKKATLLHGKYMFSILSPIIFKSGFDILHSH